MLTGHAEPLGPSELPGSKPGINFAVFSEHATSVTLELYNSDGSGAASFPLERTGNTWHVGVAGLPKSGVLYGYRVKGEGGWESGGRWDASKVMLDPYAPLVAGRSKFGVRDAFEQFREKVRSSWLLRCHRQVCIHVILQAIPVALKPDRSVVLQIEQVGSLADLRF